MERAASAHKRETQQVGALTHVTLHLNSLNSAQGHSNHNLSHSWWLKIHESSTKLHRVASRLTLWRDPISQLPCCIRSRVIGNKPLQRLGGNTFSPEATVSVSLLTLYFLRGPGPSSLFSDPPTDCNNSLIGHPAKETAYT